MTKAFALFVLVASVGTLARGSDNSVEVTIVEPDVVYGPETIAAARARGKAEAQKDIKVGNFRVRDWGKPSDKPQFDTVTGFPIERIGFRDHRSELFEEEVKAYNQTMRESHAKYKPEKVRRVKIPILLAKPEK
jgi:hypothetical protein